MALKRDRSGRKNVSVGGAGDQAASTARWSSSRICSSTRQRRSRKCWNASAWWNRKTTCGLALASTSGRTLSIHRGVAFGRHARFAQLEDQPEVNPLLVGVRRGYGNEFFGRDERRQCPVELALFGLNCAQQVLQPRRLLDILGKARPAHAARPPGLRRTGRSTSGRRRASRRILAAVTDRWNATAVWGASVRVGRSSDHRQRLAVGRDGLFVGVDPAAWSPATSK